MRLLLGLALLASAAFAQITPDNAAGDSIRKRILGLDLLNPPKRLNLPPLVVAANVPPKLCSVPLLNAMRAPINDKMHIVAPRLNPESISRAEFAQLPAPPCGEPVITKQIQIPAPR
jgi:hypothetical protein